MATVGAAGRLAPLRLPPTGGSSTEYDLLVGALVDLVESLADEFRSIHASNKEVQEGVLLREVVKTITSEKIATDVGNPWIQAKYRVLRWRSSNFSMLLKHAD